MGQGNTPSGVPVWGYLFLKEEQRGYLGKVPNAHSCRAAFGGSHEPISENPVMAKFSFGEHRLPHTQLNKVYEGCCWSPFLKKPSMIVKGKPTISPSAIPIIPPWRTLPREHHKPVPLRRTGETWGWGG